MGGFSIWHWLIVLLIVVMVFGTKKLKNMGSDLGGAVKGFKDGMRDGGQSAAGNVTHATERSCFKDGMRDGGQSAADDKPSAPAGQVTNAQAADKAERNTIDVEARQKS